MRLINRAIKARRAQVALYGVNIFNYEHMANACSGQRELIEYAQHLRAAAAAERFEQRKEKLVLEALIAQRATVPAWRRWLA